MTPEEFGELIRSHREAKGLSIADLAARFKLSAHTIRSIEDGSLDNMPHMVYAKGFVRACAQAVDLSPEDIAKGLALLFPEDQEDDVPTIPSPIGTSASRSFRHGGTMAEIFFALVFLALLCGIGWLVYANFDAVKGFFGKTATVFVSPGNGPDSGGSPVAWPVTEEIAPEQPSRGASSARQPSSDVSANTVSAPDDSGAEGQRAAAPEAPATAVPADQSGPAADSAADVAAEPAIINGKQIGIHATEDCWVEAAVDGSKPRSFTVLAGTSATLPYKDKIVLVLGNAGGITLTHDGKGYPHNGKRNERRTFTFQ